MNVINSCQRVIIRLADELVNYSYRFFFFFYFLFQELLLELMKIWIKNIAKAISKVQKIKSQAFNCSFYFKLRLLLAFNVNVGFCIVIIQFKMFIDVI